MDVLLQDPLFTMPVSSVQFSRSVVSDSLRPHESQHARPPCPSPTPWGLSVQFSSVAQSFPTLCDPTNHSTPGLPVHHQLLEFTQTPVFQGSVIKGNSRDMGNRVPDQLSFLCTDWWWDNRVIFQESIPSTSWSQLVWWACGQQFLSGGSQVSIKNNSRMCIGFCYLCPSGWN